MTNAEAPAAAAAADQMKKQRRTSVVQSSDTDMDATVLVGTPGYADVEHC